MDFAFWLMIIATAFVAIWIPVIILSQKKVHPKALFTLFFAELWERFSFYGMRALLILYMTKELFEQMSQPDADARAYGIYGAYGALVYAMPVLGGLAADKVMGFRKAVLFGGGLMALGHFTLGLEGAFFDGSLPLFFIALALIIIGNGFFKPNISSFLGTFYEQNDPRKDGAFTIFYMGVNIGAMLAPLWCGYLQVNYGWHYGFGLAGVGMVIGLIVFWKNMSNYEDKGNAPQEYVDNPKAYGVDKNVLTVVAALAGIPLCAFLLNVNEVMSMVLFGVGIVVIGYLLYYAFTTEGKKEGQRLLVVIVLFFFHMIFWALFEQAGGSLMLFADRNVDRSFFGSEIPTAFFASLNPLYIILLAPAFSWMWLKLSNAKREPSTPMKFFLGLLQIGLGYAVIVLGAQFFGGDGTIPLIFLALMYLLHTTGELSLSPVGLSMVTKLSPPKIVGFVMGAWFLSISFAHEIAAKLGQMTSTPAEDATLVESMNGFIDVYWTWGVLVVGAASVVLLLLVPTLKKWMHGIH